MAARSRRLRKSRTDLRQAKTVGARFDLSRENDR